MIKMNVKRLLKETRLGSVLPLVVLIVLLMVVIGLGVTNLGMQSRLFAVHSAIDITARSAADAALSNAIYEMNEKLKVKPWNKTTLPAAADVTLLECDAAFDYTVFESNDVYSVEGIGKAGSRIHTINSVLRLSSPFDYALLTRDTIELKHCAEVEWYNNQPDDRPLQIGTMSTNAGAVMLMSSSRVNGDVLVGVGGDPEVVIDGKSGSVITGDTYPIITNPEVPTVDVPDSIEAMASGGKIKDPMTINTSGKYEEIDLGNSETLTISGKVTLYITGDVTMGNDANIVIEPNSSLDLYIGGNFEGKNSAGFNNLTADAKNLGLFCLDSCAKVELKNRGIFYGTIYAPNSAVDLYNGADVYGSIIAKSFVLKNSGRLFYDVNLRDRTVEDELVRFSIARWSE